ncbi:phosphoribosylglycinamide formyltransferase [Lipingzhangella sp. LS1_29]|uniref:Phosphoribosylglycinamide formyltransferase n=1 Tax=Lipingzhangella rawalii TaxID=2055835 RepID=A0ABU2H4W0_9ACTN|nr:phosphoribosylglycinamide formyltransferase [Lipingzhangella rawalii]MDS1269855.1 phosphoribosylglycinamide formyltransferase [Lipingzhangella rawalii]
MRVVVLVSGAGSTMAALLEASRAADYGATIVAVGADRSDARGLELARAAGVATFVVPFAQYDDRSAWDRALAERVVDAGADLVVGAGFMRILGPPVLRAAPVVNVHPALLPAFPGAHAVRSALQYGVTVTGATVHFMDEGVDTGPIIAQEPVAVRADDDEHSLHARIKPVEQRLLVDTVGRLARHGWRVHGRHVHLGSQPSPSPDSSGSPVSADSPDSPGNTKEEAR